MRPLKTKFPCRNCGAPAEVKRLREAEHATCGPCFKRYRALSRIGLFCEAANAHAKRGNEQDGNENLLGEWFKGLSDCAKAISVSVEVLGDLSPFERRRVMRNAQRWAKWMRLRTKELESFLRDVADGTCFRVVPGGLTETLPNPMPGPAIHLSIVGTKPGATP